MVSMAYWKRPGFSLSERATTIAKTTMTATAIHRYATVLVTDRSNGPIVGSLMSTSRSNSAATSNSSFLPPGMIAEGLVDEGDGEKADDPAPGASHCSLAWPWPAGPEAAGYVAGQDQDVQRERGEERRRRRGERRAVKHADGDEAHQDDGDAHAHAAEGDAERKIPAVTRAPPSEDLEDPVEEDQTRARHGRPGGLSDEGRHGRTGEDGGDEEKRCYVRLADETRPP